MFEIVYVIKNKEYRKEFDSLLGIIVFLDKNKVMIKKITYNGEEFRL